MDDKIRDALADFATGWLSQHQVSLRVLPENVELLADGDAVISCVHGGVTVTVQVPANLMMHFRMISGFTTSDRPDPPAPPEVYFFGVWDEYGHHLRGPGRALVLDDEPIVYFEGVGRDGGEPRLARRHLDGTLAPRRSRRSGIVSCSAAGLDPYASEECPQGQFLRHDLSNGFTAIQWWDRTQGDARGACNSTVLARGRFTSGEMLAIFAEHFPSRKARLDAAGIVLVEVDP